MLTEIKEILSSYGKTEEVTPETNFKTELGLNSFDFVNLIVIMEEKFGVEFEEEDYRNINTIGDLVGYIEKAQKKESE